MSYEDRRKKLLDLMENNSILLLYSGIENHISSDTYFDFECNRHFFYLTGLRRENMLLFMEKNDKGCSERLFIEPVDPKEERWTGKMVSEEEARQISGIKNIGFTGDIETMTDFVLTRHTVKNAYFDTYRHRKSDSASFNQENANIFARLYPGICVKNVDPLVSALRMNKDKEEIALTQRAVDITKDSLLHTLSKLKPGIMEYQAQAEFEYKIHMLGAEKTAFNTIAGSGAAGTMLHYETNREECKDGTLLLLDLGARYEGYNADITRTYPVNGKFTARQKAIYDVVLKANREIKNMAKPGLTLRELNDRTKEVLAEGLIELGLIKDAKDVDKYYMHSVSHHLGIDVHDVTVQEKAKLEPGMIITDEPGLYVDEDEIGIRIEDDLLITKDGCVCLSEDIIRTTEEIEAEMEKYC